MIIILTRNLSLQVILLLHDMGLNQYQETFQLEGITGDILVELDEEVLQTELGVTSRIHRIKLLKLISGQHSAHRYTSLESKV